MSITHLLFSLHYHDLILLYDLHIASNGGELPTDIEIAHLDHVSDSSESNPALMYLPVGLQVQGSRLLRTNVK
jgi:hypothetical protein